MRDEEPGPLPYPEPDEGVLGVCAQRDEEPVPLDKKIPSEKRLPQDARDRLKRAPRRCLPRSDSPQPLAELPSPCAFTRAC